MISRIGANCVCGRPPQDWAIEVRFDPFGHFVSRRERQHIVAELTDAIADNLPTKSPGFIGAFLQSEPPRLDVNVAHAVKIL